MATHDNDTLTVRQGHKNPWNLYITRPDLPDRFAGVVFSNELAGIVSDALTTGDQHDRISLIADSLPIAEKPDHHPA